MDETTFYSLVNLAKAEFERSRAWRKLVTKNSSNTISGSTSYSTSFAVPSGFLMFLPRKNIKVIDSNGNQIGELVEKKWEDWDEFKMVSGYFTVDHKNSVFYISGVAGSHTSATLHLFYIGSSTTIASGASWVFPDEFHPALAFTVAAMDELGMDYDDINARQGNANYGVAQRIMRSAIKWDDTLQRSALGA